jgi:hypothetical protein
VSGGRLFLPLFGLLGCATDEMVKYGILHRLDMEIRGMKA